MLCHCLGSPNRIVWVPPYEFHTNHVPSLANPLRRAIRLQSISPFGGWASDFPIQIRGSSVWSHFNVISTPPPQQPTP